MLNGMASVAASVVLVLCALSPAGAQEAACAHRGQLDALYCDEDRDLVADAPKDPKRWRDPSALVWAHPPVEEPARYIALFKPFTDHLQACTGKRVVYYPVQSNTGQIEAMRSGRLHFAGISTGPTGFAVNLAGAVPFAAMGRGESYRGYNLVAVVKASAPFKTLADLKGKRVAHTTPASNSGNLAPRVLFPGQGLSPDLDYKPLMSGGHDKALLGVASGEYDAAAVASDVLERMAARGTIKGEEFRVIYRSPVFPSSSFAHAHDLKPELAAKLRECFFSYRFPPEMAAEFNGDDRFVPLTYKDAWAVVRDVAERSGAPYDKAAFDAETRREAEAAARQAAPAPAPASVPARP